MAGAPGPSGLVGQRLENQAGTRAEQDSDRAVVGVREAGSRPCALKKQRRDTGQENMATCTGFWYFCGSHWGRRSMGGAGEALTSDPTEEWIGKG